MGECVVVGAVIFLVVVGVVWAGGGFDEQKKKKQFQTIRLEQGQEVCVWTKRSRQCFGVDDVGRLGWFNPGPPSPGHLITFRRLSQMVRRGEGATQMVEGQGKPVAVSSEEFRCWGCPYCGYRSGCSAISGGGTAVWTCGKCGRSCAVVAEGITKSAIGFGDFYPELQEHPRRGTPSHGAPDSRPESGGEYFQSRGIGLDSCKCFVCAAGERHVGGNVMLNNIAAFVQCRAAGERVVAMFEQGARLDYREHEPDRVQVKVGACDQHLVNLRVLDRICEDGVITSEKIQRAILRPVS